MDGPRTTLMDCSSTYELDQQRKRGIFRREPEAWIYLQLMEGSYYGKVCIPIQDGKPYTTHVGPRMEAELRHPNVRGYCFQWVLFCQQGVINITDLFSDANKGGQRKEPIPVRLVAPENLIWVRIP